MNRSDNLDHARRLVNQYYDGAATQEQTVQLRELLESLQPLPADLAADMSLLRMIDEAREEVYAVTEVPDGLEDTLRMNLRRQARAGRMRMRRRLMGWGAAAALVVGIGGTYVARYDSDVDLSGGYATAMTDTVHDSHGERAASAPEAIAAVQTAPAVSATGAGSEDETVTPRAAADRRSSPVEPRAMKVQSAAEHSTRLSASDSEALAMAFGDLKETSGEIFSSMRQEVDRPMTDIVLTMAEVHTELVDGVYSGTPVSGMILEP